MSKRILFGLGLPLISAGGLLAYARWIEPNRIEVEEVEIAVPGLPQVLENLEIVFLSDLQIERPGRRETELLARLEAIAPDLVLIAGDFANSPYYASDYIRYAAAACSVVSRIPAHYGKFAVWGNNDHPEFIEGFARAAGIRVLENECADIEVHGERLTLVGLDDPVTQRDDWAKTLREPPEHPMLMIVHSPDAFPEAVVRGIPVVLAGHTHGGQIRHPFIRLDPVRFLKLKPGTPPYRAGLYRDGGSVLYVSRGLGTSNLPVRFLCPPEITRIRVRSAGRAPPRFTDPPATGSSPARS